jgi:hypothetical protein
MEVVTESSFAKGGNGGKSGKKGAPGALDARVANVDELFAAMVNEARVSANFIPDSLAGDVSLSDTLFYHIENKMAANWMTKYYLLVVVIVFFWVLYTALWYLAANYSDPLATSRLLSGAAGGHAGEDVEETQNWNTAAYLVFQILMAGGYDDGIDVNAAPLWAVLFLVVLFTGLGVFAVLVGFVNETVTAIIDGINEGQSKIAASGHTLILGWNESTVRVVCQIAFLRRAFIQQNETIVRRLFWWTRAAPSTPVAARPVVILCNTMTKHEMDSILGEALSERGIDPKRTRIGDHIVCRIGNPTDPHDLLRAGAHRATSILVMMTELDKEEEDNTDGVIQGGATLSTLLALRHVMLKSKNPKDTSWTDFRCVVHSETSVMVGGRNYMEGATFTNNVGADVVHFVDLRAFVNTLMLTCTAQPGLSAVFLELLSFEGVAFRSKKAADLGVVGMTLGELRFRYTKAVIAGVVDTRNRLEGQTPVADQGIACDSARRITDHDRIVLISETISPPLWTGDRANLKHLVGNLGAKKRKPFDILVCGWRPEWNIAARFAARVEALARALPDGSVLCFLNRLTYEEFSERMAETSFAPFEETWVCKGVILKHKHGDAADPEILHEVMSAVKYEAAIVMGTLHGTTALPAESRDRRVQMTMLLLRTTQALIYGSDRSEAPIHVVGENAIDSSAALALAPMSMRNIPDFVNTQAINARALTQSLAYPFMQAAIAQLFNNGPDSPQMCLVNPGEHLIPPGSASFAEVMATVEKEYPNDVLVGLITHDGKMLIAPDLDFVHSYDEKDQIILLSRRFGVTAEGRANASKAEVNGADPAADAPPARPEALPEGGGLAAAEAEGAPAPSEDLASALRATADPETEVTYKTTSDGDLKVTLRVPKAVLQKYQ